MDEASAKPTRAFRIEAAGRASRAAAFAAGVILLGALGILVMLFTPKGLWGLVSERYDLTLFPTRRRLVVSVRDDERRA